MSPAAVILIVAAYLLGSVPFALVIGKGIFHQDVRESGSGNIGTTNVFRVLGKGAGTLVFIGDLGKGFLPAFLVAQTSLISTDNQALTAVLAAGAAIVGHTFPIFLKFKGGKGVATGGGAVMALMPWLFLAAFASFWAVLLIGRTVSIASLTAATALSVLVVITGQPTAYIVFTIACTAVIFYAHRSNIGRLLKGEENRVSFPWNRT